MDEHWCTPKSIVDAVRVAFGGRIELDPCSHARSVVRAANEWLPPDADGLAEEWDFATIFVNPPFRSGAGVGRGVGDWLEKCADAKRRHSAHVVALVPAAVTSPAWQRSVWGCAQAVCFLYAERIDFHVEGRPIGGVKTPCAVVCWGGRFAAFERAFAPLGAVLDLRTIAVPSAGRRRAYEVVAPF